MSKFLQVGVEGGEAVKYGVGIEGGRALVGVQEWRCEDCNWVDICITPKLPEWM